MFVWVSMMIGLWIIASFIVPFEIPGLNDPVIVGSVKVIISLLLVMTWLWTWREIVRRTFWKTMRRQQELNTINNE